MKLLTILAAVSTLCLAQSSFAYTAVTTDAPETNAKGAGNILPGAQIGDTFSVTMGSFASYLPAPGDPIIAGANPDGTGGDLSSYRFSMSGTVTGVNGNQVSYAGFYQIFYDLNHDGIFDGSDTSVSFGTLGLLVNFNGGSPYAADGNLFQTQGPTGPGASSFAGFSDNSASFNGQYIQVTPAGGFVQGTISSPDTTTTLGLLGLSTGALLAFKRRVSVA
jgi:hypothetical protein